MMAASDNKAWVPRILRGAVTTALGALAVGGGAMIVLWDADFYAAREKYEHLKLAFFGEWQPRNWCPPGRDTDNCQQVGEFAAALEGAENFNFFRTLPVDGTDLTVITGVEFASALDVVASEPSHLWCYMTFGQGALARRITLARMNAGASPNFTDFAGIAGGETDALPLSAERLSALAQSHCQFNEFTPPSQ